MLPLDVNLFYCTMVYARFLIWALLFYVPALIHGNERGLVQFDSEVNDNSVYQKNEGQIVDHHQKLCPDILYKVAAVGADFYVRNNGVSYVQYKVESNAKALFEPRGVYETEDAIETLIGHRVDINLVGANLSKEIIEEGESKTSSHYYLGHCPDGIIGVKSYEKVLLKNIYPGIDWVHYSKSGHLEYDFIVQPGADPSQIKMKINGADNWKITPKGDLKIKTSLGEIIERAPVVFQDGKELNASYKIDGEYLSFEIEKYNPAIELRIDPVRVWATYLGGSLHDFGDGGITANQNGEVYVVGKTSSTNFPVSVGAFQTTMAGAGDVSIGKFDSNGGLVWATYYGGSIGDNGGKGGITIDPNGDIIVHGFTLSNNFPITIGAFSGGIDAFLIKFNPNGIRQWATCYGGAGGDLGVGGVVTDANGNIYVHGLTWSTNFPVSAGAFQGAFAGNQDVYLAKFSGAGNMLWGTYYGGSDFEVGVGGLTIDPSGNLFLFGNTRSTNLPISTGAYQTTLGGATDNFLAKFSTNGNFLMGTYLGGNSDEYTYGSGITTDQLGNVYVHGQTKSWNFPVTTGAFQPSLVGLKETYISKFTGAGGLIWSTYFGGLLDDYPGGIVIDQKNNIYIHGNTSSASFSLFPVTSDAFQLNNAGSKDAYIAQFSGNGNRKWCSFYGGTGIEEALGGIAQDNKGGVYIHGKTNSFNFPISTGAYQNQFKGVYDSYVVKFNFREIEHTGKCEGDSIFFSLSDTNNITSVLWNFDDPSSGALNMSTALSPFHIYNSAGQFITQCLVTGTTGIVDTLYDTVNIISFPQINWGADTLICTGDSLKLSVDTSFTYQWSTGDTSSFINVTTAGSYSVTITGECGVTADTINVSLLTIPVVDLGPDTILCAGDSLWLKDASLLSTYLWSTGSASDSILVMSQDTYFLSVTNSCGQAYDSIKVYYDINPITNLGPDSVYCITTLQLLDATFSRASYLWNTGDTSGSITVDTSGVYSVNVVNLCGHDGDTVSIKYVKPIQLDLGNDTSLCKGDSLILKPKEYTTNWEWGNGSKDSALVVTQAGTYTIQASNLCGVFTDQILVTEKIKPTITSVADTFLCKGGYVPVSVEQNNADRITWSDSNVNHFNRTFSKEGEYTYVLENECGTSSDSFTITLDSALLFSLGKDTMLCGGSVVKEFHLPNHQFEWNDGFKGAYRELVQRGIYTLTITTPGGCKSSDNIEVKNCLELFIPNAFTPNNDGINDQFEVKGIGVDKFAIRIFDRWGNQVYESFEITESWDGTSEGKPAMIGVYSYKIWYGQGRESKVALGAITLIR